MLALAGRALRHRNFRLFTVGQSISLIGTWMQQVAVGWLVYRLTDSPFLLGLVGFVSQGPIILLAPFAGVFADRHDKRRIVLFTQVLMALQATTLAVLVLTDTIAIWQIITLMAMLGALHGIDIPARQSFLLEMVGNREDLPNAIALNSSMFNGARLVGPAIAGVVVAAAGEGICILINAVSYVAVLSALLAMRIAPRARPGRHGAVLEHMTEGFRYAYGFLPIRSILSLVAFVSLVAVPFNVLLPVVATDVLGGDAATLGFLMAAVGLGALAGALFLASRTTVRGLSRVIAAAATLFGAALIAVALSRTLWLSLVCLAVAGFGMMVQMASSNTVLQTIVDDDKRGRVMSLYSMAFTGMMPIGALVGGAIASALGAPATIALGGLGCLAGTAVFARQLPALRANIRPIYSRLGIIPEVATGIQAATHNLRPSATDGN
ncbi:MAG: MFS transporter [Gemmatimonadetes bacterium]|nr:MFS transporter [Gemmatimonadota bacterium]